MATLIRPPQPDWDLPTDLVGCPGTVPQDPRPDAFFYVMNGMQTVRPNRMNSENDSVQPIVNSEEEPTTGVREKRPRGFALLKLTNPERVAEIARKGGKSAHAQGTAHEFTSEEARAAGRKGGHVAHARRRAAREATGQ